MPKTPSKSHELLQQQMSELSKEPKAAGVSAPKAAGIEYNSDLQRVTKQVREDINRSLIPILGTATQTIETNSGGTLATIVSIFDALRGKYSSPVFSSVASKIAASFVVRADSISQYKYDRMLKSFGISGINSAGVTESEIQSAIFANTRLIKTIPTQYLDQVESMVTENLRAGARPSVITKQLIERYNVTRNRAKLIARDQTAKVNADLTKARQTATGFEYFRWQTVKDNRVRDRHESLASRITAYGKGIYRWDNPPLSSKGTPITPGKDFQCRCVAIPVSNAEVERNKKFGKTNPAVRR